MKVVCTSCFSAIEAKLFKSQGRIGKVKSRQTM